jgi:hypothetical protein
LVKIVSFCVKLLHIVGLCSIFANEYNKHQHFINGIISAFCLVASLVGVLLQGGLRIFLCVPDAKINPKGIGKKL